MTANNLKSFFSTREPSWPAVILVLAVALVMGAFYVFMPYSLREVNELAPVKVDEKHEFIQFESEQNFRSWLGGVDEREDLVDGIKLLLGDILDEGEPEEPTGTESSQGWAESSSVSGARLQSTVVTSDRVFFAHEKGVLALDTAVVDQPLVITDIDSTGKLMVIDQTLLVVNENELLAYSVNDLSPKWKREFKGSKLLDAEAEGGSLYLAFSQPIDDERPCEIRPLSDEFASSGCQGIWHSTSPSYVDSLYSLVQLNVVDGSVISAKSITGDNENTQVHVVGNKLAVAMSQQKSSLDVLTGFFISHSELTTSDLHDRIRRLSEYSISEQAKSSEFKSMLESWHANFNDDDRHRLDLEIRNRLAGYLDENSDELDRTTVVVLDSDSGPEAVQIMVGGSLYGETATAVTSGDELRLLISGVDLSALGAPKKPVYAYGVEIGRQDEIESAQVSRNGKLLRAYLLGDRIISSDGESGSRLSWSAFPNSGEANTGGELPLLAEYSFVHDLSDGKVLVVSKDGSQTRLTVFHFNGREAKELSHYSLDEYWSDVVGTHEAFAVDLERAALVVPADLDAIVFGYADGKLAIAKLVKGVNPERIAIVGNRYYLFEKKRVTILRSGSWETIGSLERR